eukprot:941701-Pelagomonas_calceolata.AAC.1
MQGYERVQLSYISDHIILTLIGSHISTPKLKQSRCLNGWCLDFCYQMNEQFWSKLARQVRFPFRVSVSECHQLVTKYLMHSPYLYRGSPSLAPLHTHARQIPFCITSQAAPQNEQSTSFRSTEEYNAATKVPFQHQITGPTQTSLDHWCSNDPTSPLVATRRAIENNNTSCSL